MGQITSSEITLPTMQTPSRDGSVATESVDLVQIHTLPARSASTATTSVFAPGPGLRIFLSHTKTCVIAIDACIVLLATSLVLAMERRHVKYQTGQVQRADFVLLILMSVIFYGVGFIRARAYVSRFLGRSIDEIRRVTRGAVFGAGAVALTAFAFDLHISRAWVAWTLILAIIGVLGARLWLRRVFWRLRAQGLLLRRIVIVGDNAEGRALCAMLQGDLGLGYYVAAVVNDRDAGAAERDADGDSSGAVHGVLEVVRATGSTGVVIATTAIGMLRSNRLVRELTHAGIHVELSSTLLDISASRMFVRPLGRFPVVYVEAVKRFGWRTAAKRCFDLVLAVGLLVLTAPVIAASLLAIKLESPGPVFFRQIRVGRDGKPFLLFKLRTMVVDAEARLDEVRQLNEVDGPLFKMRNDPRVTRIGRVLRSLSIDELPQLVNVLRNEMSIVGPRPALPHEVDAWGEDLRSRLRVKPGLTGMWQVHGRSDASFAEYERLYLYYVDNWSIVTDLAIVVRTIPAVISRRGAR
jgi:exopolysaccharide biosynthesis polyprenyl glycosylphosphotransferase